MYKIPTPAPRRVCKDCAAENPSRALTRDAPYPGPRCFTHNRAFRKIQRIAAHDKRVVKVFNLAPGEYDDLCAFQGGLCAICRRAKCIGNSGKYLAVDHNHLTMEPRGLCCVTCNNILLGQYDVEALQRAIDYLLDPPYARMTRLKESSR